MQTTKKPHSPSSCDHCTDSDCTASRRKKDESEEAFAERRLLQSRLFRIRHKVIVLSGKGGVGKSMVAVNLAMALKMASSNSF